jgi:hypothetical protein
MVPPFDIFQMKSGYVLWCEAAATVEMAQERVQKLALSAPGGYLIFNQQTGQHVPVNRFSSQVEYPIARGDVDDFIPMPARRRKAAPLGVSTANNDWARQS